jgi:RNA recognition motif-containing protein
MTEQRKLFVGSLKWELTEVELREVFEPFGELDEVKIILDKETGRSRGFGFIKFKNADDAKTALEEMQDFTLMGRKLHVVYAESKDPSQRRDVRSLPPSDNVPDSTDQYRSRPTRRERTRRSDEHDD